MLFAPASSPRKDFLAQRPSVFQNHYSKGIVTRQGKCQLKEKKMAALINQSGGLKLFAKLSFIKPAIDVIDEAIIMIICLFALRVLHSLLHSFKDTFFYWLGCFTIFKDFSLLLLLLLAMASVHNYYLQNSTMFPKLQCSDQ